MAVEDDEADVGAALEEARQAYEKQARERQIKQAKGGIRWGLIGFAGGGVVWLLSNANLLPDAFVTADTRAGCLVVAAVGLSCAVLNFFSVRANRLGTERAKAQFRAGMAMIEAVIVIVGASVVAILLTLFAVLLLGVGETPAFLFSAAVVVVMVLVAIATYFRRRTRRLTESVSTFIEEQVFPWATAVFFGTLAATMALLFCLKLIIAVREARDGHVTASLVFVAWAAVSLGIFVFCARLVWNAVASSRLSRVTQVSHSPGTAEW